jgi:hypothetical protein
MHLSTMWPQVRSNSVLFVSLLLLLAVGWQNLTARRENRAILASIARSQSPVVRVGDWAGEIAGVGPGDRYVRVPTDGQAMPTLVLAFSVDCGFCQQSRQAWARLAQRASDGGLSVIWLSRDRAAVAFAEAWAPAVIAEPSRDSYERLKLRVVPQTLIVDRAGVIQFAFAGVVGPDDEQTIATAILRASPRGFN